MAETEESSADDDICPWLVAERSSLENLAIPIKLNRSVQFTAIEVSRSYIWCGSNRSNLYVFDRQSLKHVYLIPISSMTDIDSVTQLAIYHTEQLCAVAVGCQVYTAGIHSGTTKKPEVVEALTAQTTVTQLVWHENSTKLYVGDNSGCIHVCSIMTYKMIPRSSALCKLDSCIVQLDFRSHVLLAATLTKCVSYHTDKKTLIDIGKKARNGCYGAVLLPPAQTEEQSITTPDPLCYCARPGLRLWRADIDGKVLATLNFKQALARCPLSPIHSSLIERVNSTSSAEKSRVSAFSYLRSMSDGYILSVSNNKMVVLDPATSSVLISAEVEQGIISCCVDRNSCYVVTGEGDVRCVELFTLTDYLETLLGAAAIYQAVDLALSYRTFLRKHEPLLSRIQQLMSAEGEQHKEFTDVFSEPIEAYLASAANRSSRSSTVSSFSGQSTVDSYGSNSSGPPPLQVYRQQSQKEVESTSSACEGSVEETTAADTTAADTTSADTTAADLENSGAVAASDVERNGSAAAPIGCVNSALPPQSISDETSAQSPTKADTIAMSPTTPLSNSFLSSHDSTKSAASLDPIQVEPNNRRSSFTSTSSFDQSGDYSEDSVTHKAKSNSRRVKASTIKFPSTDAGDGDDSGNETSIYQTSSSIPISRSSSGQQSLSRSKSSARDSSSPTSTATSPGAVADHVKDVKGHVIDGFSKISNQAKSLISTIKERTISQPVIEKLLSATSRDDLPDGTQTPGDSREDSGSHQVFFIGDEEISMNKEMPSALGPFLELTESTYSQLTDPFELFINEQLVQQQLGKWCEKLCLVLAQYTHTGGKPKTLRGSTRVCPWRMNPVVTAQCEFLATLCVLRACSEPVLGYTIDRECEASSQYLIPDTAQVSQYVTVQKRNKFDESYDFSQLYSDEHERRTSVSSNDCVGSPPFAANELEQIAGDCPGLDTGDSSLLVEKTGQSTNQNDSADDIEKVVSALANGSQSPPHVTSPLAHVTSPDNIQADQTMDCPSLVLLCQSMATFWFLMNTSELCSHIEQLSAVNSKEDEQRAVWMAFINCLVGNTYDRLEWKPVFNTSLYTSSDAGKQLLKQNDKAGLWLVVYLLIRQHQLEEAISIASDSHMQVPPIHVLFSLQTACKLDNLCVLTAQQQFAGYIQSLIQQEEASARSRFLLEHLVHSELLSYWMECLESCWRAGETQQRLCSCGQPTVLTSEGTTTNLQFTVSDIINLLEENLLHVAGVQSTILLIGGSSALLRLRMRNGEREEVLKLFLLASDCAVVHHHLGRARLTSADCLYLLKQRALQEADEADNVCCLWCREVYNRSEPLLTWDSIAELIVGQLGAEACVDVLLEASLPEQSVSHHFFSGCVKTHQHNLQSSQMVSDAIDGLEKFLWSNELADKTCDARMYQLMLREAELNKVVRNGGTISDSEHNQLLEMSNTLRETESLRSIEDTEVHWGATVNLSDDCYHCGLQLSRPNMNVTVLQCGHCAHQSCCQAAVGCPQCLTSSN